MISIVPVIVYRKTYLHGLPAYETYVDGELRGWTIKSHTGRWGAVQLDADEYDQIEYHFRSRDCAALYLRRLS